MHTNIFCGKGLAIRVIYILVSMHISKRITSFLKIKIHFRKKKDCFWIRSSHIFIIQSYLKFSVILKLFSLSPLHFLWLFSSVALFLPLISHLFLIASENLCTNPVMHIQETVNICRMAFCEWCLALGMCKFNACAQIVFRFHVFRALFLCMHNTSVFGHIGTVPMLFRVFACAEHFATGKSRCCHLKF